MRRGIFLAHFRLEAAMIARMYVVAVLLVSSIAYAGGGSGLGRPETLGELDNQPMSAESCADMLAYMKVRPPGFPEANLDSMEGACQIATSPECEALLDEYTVYSKRVDQFLEGWCANQKNRLGYIVGLASPSKNPDNFLNIIYSINDQERVKKILFAERGKGSHEAKTPYDKIGGAALVGLVIGLLLRGGKRKQEEAPSSD